MTEHTKEQLSESPQLLSITAASKLLNVSTWTLRRMLNRGQLPVVRLPIQGRTVRRLLFDKNDLVQLIRRSKELED